MYERYIRTAAPYRRVRVVSKRPAQSYRGDAGHTHTHHSERSQEHRDTLLYHRFLQQEALYFYNTPREDRPQEHLRSGSTVTGVIGQRLPYPLGDDTLLQAIMNLDRDRRGGAVTSQPGVRGRRLPCPLGEDALLQAIMNLDQEADGDGVRSRFRSARVPKQQLNTSATRPENQSEKLRPSRDLSGGSTEESPHASASASKIFFSDLDVIPGLGEDPEEPTVKEQCAQLITHRAREIEKLYKQDCETLGMAVKMLISKDPTLEQRLLAALTQNLVDIREKCLGNLSQFISEVNALLKEKETRQTKP